MRTIPWRPIACSAAVLVGVTTVCLVSGLVVWIGADAQARQLPFIEPGTASELIRAAQAQDPTAEITGATVACELGPWQCFWDASNPAIALSQDLSDRILRQIVRVDGPTNVDFVLTCEERFDEGQFEPGYVCTWDPGSDPRSLPVR